VGNYKLKRSSPAIDAGINVGLPFDGSAPDMGAYESNYQSAKAPSLRLKGDNTGTASKLHWETTDESNTGSFEVLKSTDGVHFEVISQVAADTTSGGAVYSFIDDKAYSSENYYQIKQVGKDGKYGFSKVIGLSHPPAADILISPNPATNTLVVSLRPMLITMTISGVFHSPIVIVI